MSDLKQPFEIQTDAIDYAMGVVLLQRGKPILFHSENFNGVVISCPTYDKEIYALVQIVNKRKHYLMGKETIIHTNHQPFSICAISNKIAVIKALLLDGILPTIPRGNNVQERYS